MTGHDNESWIIEAGDHIVEKKHDVGMESLASAEKLIYCVWVADYGMRNAGDLAVAEDIYPDFHSEAARLASMLGLSATAKTFALPVQELEGQYFAQFDTMCDELRKVARRMLQGDEP